MKFSKRLSRFFEDFFHMIRIRRFYLSAMVSFLFLALTIALPVWRIVPLAGENPFIPLHYNIYLGIDRFGAWKEIFWLPAVGAFLFILNLFLQAWVFRREKFFATLFAFSTVVIEMILFLAMSLIVLLNLSYAA